MGAVCQLNQQQGQETYNFQETYNHMSASREVKPKATNTSIILDLKVKYLELDCNLCCKPQMKEMAVQTQVSFNNLNQQDTWKIKQLSQKKKKKRQIDLKDNLQYYEECRLSSASQSSQTQNQLSLFQVYNNQKKHKLQDFKPYMVLINSQQESMTYRSPNKKQHN